MQSFFKFIGVKFAALVVALALAGCSASGGTDPQWLMQVAHAPPAILARSPIRRSSWLLRAQCSTSGRAPMECTARV